MVSKMAPLEQPTISTMTGSSSFQDHYFFLKNAADLFDLPATLDLTTSIVKLGYPNTQLADALFPQFSKRNENNQRIYNAFFEKYSDRFAGWRPYTPIYLDALKDKLTFKIRLIEEGCLVPDFREDQTQELLPVIVKAKQSAFSQDIHGPFHSTQNVKTPLAKGHFFEQFIAGDIVKIWYVNAKPSCIEIADMPSIIGNGNSTCQLLIHDALDMQHFVSPEKLLLKRLLQGETISKNENSIEKAQQALNNLGQMLAFQGLRFDTILSVDQTALIDFRYVHPFPRNNRIHCLDRCAKDFSSMTPQLTTIGQTMQRLLSEVSCDFLVYTVDSILDQKQQLWVLEANSNPMIHPFVYEDMVRFLVNKKAVPKSC